MNASDIIEDNMSLEQKMERIQRALERKQQEKDTERKAQGLPPVPIDPAELTICEGCQ